MQEQSGNITKYWVSTSGDELLHYIDRLPIGEQQGYTFAFELNLHRPTQDQDTSLVQQKVVLDPFVPVSYTHLAQKIEFASKISILVLSTPLFLSMLRMIIDLLP